MLVFLPHPEYLQSKKWCSQDVLSDVAELLANVKLKVFAMQDSRKQDLIISMQALENCLRGCPKISELLRSEQIWLPKYSSKYPDPDLVEMVRPWTNVIMPQEVFQRISEQYGNKSKGWTATAVVHARSFIRQSEDQQSPWLCSNPDLKLVVEKFANRATEILNDEYEQAALPFGLDAAVLKDRVRSLRYRQDVSFAKRKAEQGEEDQSEDATPKDGTFEVNGRRKKITIKNTPAYREEIIKLAKDPDGSRKEKAQPVADKFGFEVKKVQGNVTAYRFSHKGLKGSK